MTHKCPTCQSTAPHMHPAMQHGGEVETCVDTFHLRETPQNLPQYIAAVLAKRASVIAVDAAEASRGEVVA